MPLRERGFAEAKRLCYAGLDAPALLRGVAAGLRRAVPFDAYCAQTNDPLSGLLTNLIGGGAIGEREHRHYLEHVYFEEELAEQRRMVQHRCPVVRLSDVTGGRLERALRYREITGPLGLGFELFGVCSAGSEQWGGICLIREHGHPDYDGREVALLQRLAPHLGTGLKMAVLRARVAEEAAGESAPGVLILDDRGPVVRHTAAAERWLRDLDDRGRCWLEHGNLPAPVWMVIGALRRALRPQTERDLHDTPRIRAQGRSGRWLTLYATRTLSQAGHERESMIIIEPSSPRELAWLRASAYGLSERERAVVELVARGASTKEMAHALYVSEYTIQEHLSHAFDKVGARGRRALLRRLFFDNLPPALGVSPEERGASELPTTRDSA